MDLDKNISDFSLVFLDLETTGLDAVTGDSICEIAALKTQKGTVIDKFYTLVNPGRNIPEQAYNIHKISDEQVKDAPVFETVAGDLVEFLKGCIVCAYNVDFDMGFITHHLKKIDKPFLENVAIDVLSMARDAVKLPRYNLGATAKFFNLSCSGNLHQASSDALLAYKVFFKLLDIFKEKGIAKAKEFFSLYGFGNDAFRVQEQAKITLCEKALKDKATLKIRYFSPLTKAVERKSIVPLRFFLENKYFYILGQSTSGDTSNFGLRRILEIEVL